MRSNRTAARLSLIPAMLSALVVGCDSGAPSEPTADVAASPVAARAAVEPVCHLDPLAGAYVRLDLPAPAAASHRGHGDAVPGDPVPGPAGFIFDADCQPQEVPISELEQLTPINATYESLPFSGSAEGEVTGNVIPVEINLDGDRSNTSGCEASDFAGLDFSGPNDIALMQRNSCLFTVMIGHAQAAGAEAVIIFNQGNTPDREGVLSGNGSFEGFVPTVPVVGASFADGAALAQPGSTARVRTQIPD